MDRCQLPLSLYSSFCHISTQWPLLNTVYIWCIFYVLSVFFYIYIIVALNVEFSVFFSIVLVFISVFWSHTSGLDFPTYRPVLSDSHSMPMTVYLLIYYFSSGKIRAFIYHWVYRKCWFLILCIHCLLVKKTLRSDGSGKNCCHWNTTWWTLIFTFIAATV